MFFEGGGYKSRAGCHGARTVIIQNSYKKLFTVQVYCIASMYLTYHRVHKAKMA